jgi:hypothetical protein
VGVLITTFRRFVKIGFSFFRDVTALRLRSCTNGNEARSVGEDLTRISLELNLVVSFNSQSQL